MTFAEKVLNKQEFLLNEGYKLCFSGRMLVSHAETKMQNIVTLYYEKEGVGFILAVNHDINVIAFFKEAYTY